MIVCVCHNVSEREIKALLDEGLSLEEIVERTSASTGCGTCLEYLIEVIEDERTTS